MSTRVKGIFKGIRYISQIFEDHDQDNEKEEDIQIGLPTDVKHVAHIGYEASTPATADSPSWMKNPNKEDADVKWASEDSKRNHKARKSHEKDGEGHKTSRRRSTDKNSGDIAKPRHSRRSQAKDSSEGGADLPKKARRKKSESGEAGVRRSKNRADGGDAAESESDSKLSCPISSTASEDEEERECRLISNE